MVCLEDVKAIDYCVEGRGGKGKREGKSSNATHKGSHYCIAY